LDHGNWEDLGLTRRWGSRLKTYVNGLDIEVQDFGLDNVIIKFGY